MSYEPAVKRPTKRLILPSSPEYWVEYYATKNWGDRKAFRAIGARSQQDGVDELIVAADVAFERLIHDWNLNDEQGNKLPINQESFDNLADPDIDAIMDALAPVINPSQAVQEAAENEKKGSSEKPLAPSTEQANQSPQNS